MELYGYWRSSASYRVRIALGLKGLKLEHIPINLVEGAQRGRSYRGLNPQGFVPTLVTDEGVALGQSLAIIEYLEEIYPTPNLLPARAEDRAHVRQLAMLVACDIHPLNNLRVLEYLKHTLHLDEDAKKAWIHHWLAEGLEAMEQLIARHPSTGECCFGNQPGLADICLIPQLYNARRFGLDLAPYPTLTRIEHFCLSQPAFMAAHPDQQPDAKA